MMQVSSMTVVMQRGLVLTWECGLKEIICESDSLDAISTLNLPVDTLEHCDLFQKIQELLLLSWTVHFVFVHRDGNLVADWLVKRGAWDNNDYSELLEPCAELFHLLHCDLA
ncbi:hypothetical protein PIB30_074426 [Stylosanthes scabra]|uniref:RNase H type-1 domain-containing protein n=1 Tax=Stylosanthes scabra TaxID=79078 RepID=A0ABU6ZNG6_9FABA|nr:hypothetical protein [Stylosanthes scabra]